MRRRDIWLVCVLAGVAVFLVVGWIWWLTLRTWPNFLGMTRVQVVEEAIRHDIRNGSGEVMIECEVDLILETKYLTSSRDLEKWNFSYINKATHWTLIGSSWLYNGLRLEFDHKGRVVSQEPITELRP